MSIDPKIFRDTLGRFCSGITVVMVEDAQGQRGMTASAFISVSMDPPLVLVAVARRAHLHARLNDRYTLSLLAAGQDQVSNHFAGRPDPLPEGTITRNAAGHPVIAGALGWIDCVVHDRVDAGDHTLFIGRVESVDSFDGEPLAYFRGRYRALLP